MAKSEGNFLTLDSRFTEKGLDPLVYRFASFQSHYRKPMEYSDESIEAAGNGLVHLREQVRNLMEKAGAREGSIHQEYKDMFLAEINDDLNIPRALAVVQKLVKSDLPEEDRLATLLDYDRVLGLELENVSVSEDLPEEVTALVEARKRAREEKNWALSDELRDKIQDLGYVVKDAKGGMNILKR